MKRKNATFLGILILLATSLWAWDVRTEEVSMTGRLTDSEVGHEASFPSYEDSGDDGSIMVFSYSTPDDSPSALYSYSSEPLRKRGRAKMKVLSCHVTTNTQDAMRTTFPWVSSGDKVAHIAFFEILNRSDFVKFRITISGPQFSSPLTVETLTFGPQEPLHQWGIGFWKTYSTPGLYWVKMTAIPDSNTTSGRSSVECGFRVTEKVNGY